MVLKILKRLFLLGLLIAIPIYLFDIRMSDLRALTENGIMAIGFVAIGVIIMLFTMISSKNSERRDRDPKVFTNEAKFTRILLKLVALVMLADDRAEREEFEFVEKQLGKRFSKRWVKKYMDRLIQDYVPGTINKEELCNIINTEFNHAEKLHLINILAGVAASDRMLTSAEESMLEEIVRAIGLEKEELASILNMHRYESERENEQEDREEKEWEGQKWSFGGGFGNGEKYKKQEERRRANWGKPSTSELDNAYKILELTKAASDATIKKTYRKLAMKHHPDRVIHLGEEHKKIAAEKFQKINMAYEFIKKSRGFK
ncbi:MAG: DnaJ like chaperone protein [Crocinitomicaceae bacterium]|jgi:DnaJ like chaperone protein